MPKLTFFKLAVPAFLLAAAPLFAQQDSLSFQRKYKSEISFTLLGQNFLYSINYSSVLLEKNKSSLNQQLSFTYLNELPKVISYSLYKEYGKKKHHFLAGLGYMYLWEHYNYDNSTNHHFCPEAIIGYTFSNPERRVKIGLHLNLLFNDYRNPFRFTPWGGLTLGYKFNAPPSLKDLGILPALPDKFSTEIGYEVEIGTGKLSLNGFGANSIWSVTNSAFLKYNLKHIYLKAVTGATLLSTNKLKNDEFTATIFKKNPLLIHFGLGAGCLAATIYNWIIYPEIQSGMYVHVPNSELFIKNSQFESFTNFSSGNYHENTPWYFKAGLNSVKEISEKLAVNFGLNYKHSMFINRMYSLSFDHALKNLTYNSVVLNIGINFKL